MFVEKVQRQCILYFRDRRDAKKLGDRGFKMIKVKKDYSFKSDFFILKFNIKLFYFKTKRYICL